MPNLKNKWKKGVKILQKKGIYNPKLKLIVFVLVLIVGTTIGVSYAYFIDRPSDVLIIDATVGKKINVKLTTNDDSMESSLADIILDNNQVIDGDVDFSQGFPNVSTPESEKENKSGLYKTNDNDGETYYFRGKVDNNYVIFANKLWRIVRVNGDKTVRLILSSSIGSSEFNKYDGSLAGNNMAGFTYNNETPCTTTTPCKSEYQNGQFNNKNFEGQNSTIKTKLEEWYQNNLNDYDSYIAYGTFCNDTSYGDGSETGTLYYGPYERLLINSVTPQLTCPDPTAQAGVTSEKIKNGYHTYGGVYKLKIGLINADEAIMSGIYINNRLNLNATLQNYLFRADLWATASPININSNVPYLMSVGGGGIANYAVYYQTYSIYPIINLTNDKLVISGNGTQATPYKVIGSIDSTEKTVDYDTMASFNVIPQQEYQYKEASCDNKSTVAFADNTLTVTPKSSQNTICSLEFAKKIEIFNHEYSVHLGTPDFSKGFPNNSTSSLEMENKSGLYETIDNDGISYYFRGKIENNYVKFGQGITSSSNGEKRDLFWRIVRINGDGTIRLMLDDKIDTSAVKFNEYKNEIKYVGYTYDNKVVCTSTGPCQSKYENGAFKNTFGGENSNIKKILETWYQENLNDYDSYIEYGTYCNDTSYGGGSETLGDLYYGNYQRLVDKQKTALVCPDPTKQDGYTARDYGGIYKLKIGLLSADEMNFAGYASELTSGQEKANDNNWLKRTYHYWSMSPRYYNGSAYIFISSQYGDIHYSDTTNIRSVVPVINLKADVKITEATGQDGTKEHPFEIE